jgi:hypothetical protein
MTKEERDVVVREHDPLARYLDSEWLEFDATEDEEDFKNRAVYWRLSLAGIEAFLAKGDFTHIPREKVEKDLNTARKMYAKLTAELEARRLS